MLVSAYTSIICMVLWIKKTKFQQISWIIDPIIVMQAGCIYTETQTVEN
jgi:hypothetical protein